MNFFKENKWMLLTCMVVFVIYALLVWFVGPLIAIADHKILNSVLVRILVILFGLLIIVASCIYKIYRNKKKFKNDEVSEVDEKLSKVKLESKLKEKFRHLDAFLRQQKGLKEKNIFQRKFGSKHDYVYNKPWFMVVGPSHAGKTTALLNSNLTFPIGLIDAKNIGRQTEDCDCFLTDDALFLDTAGHFFEGSDSKNVKKDWGELLKILKDYRPKQPINGLILVLSAEEVLNFDEESLQAQIDKIRLRLKEIQTVFNTSCPIYIVINKIDAIRGFSQFFKFLSEKEKQLTFGVTLDPLASDSYKRIEDLLSNIDSISMKLHKNIFKSVSYNNHNDEDVDLALAFSSHFEQFSDTLKNYLQKLLVLSNYDIDLQLAGVNLTSIMQNDDVYSSVRNNDIQEISVDRVQKESKLIINPLFVENIFKKLVLSTAKMAGIDNNWLKKRKKNYWIIVGFLVVITAVFFTLLLKGFLFNRSYQNDVDKSLQKLEVNVKDIDIYHVPSVLKFITQLNELPFHGINKEKLSKSFRDNYGLSQQDNIVEASQLKNEKFINETLLPAISNEVYSSLRNSVESKNYNNAYANLKLYLMLYEKEHYDGNYVYEWVFKNIITKSVYDEKTLKLAREIFNRYKIMPQNDKDELLIERARQLLVYTDVSQVILEDLDKHVITLPPQSIPNVSYISMGGIGSNNIFRRISDKTLNDPISIIYTKYGYESVFKPFVTKRLNTIYNEEKWVIGNDAQFKSIDDVLLDIYRLYSQNYVNAWKGYLSDIKMIKPESLQHAITMAKQLSEKNSSLAGIIKGISINTNYTVENLEKSNKTNSQTTANTRAVVKSTTKKEIKIDESKVQGYLENISNSFSPFRNLISGGDNESHLNDITKSINDLYIYLLALEFSIQSEDQLLPDVKPLINYKAQINRLPEPFKPMLDVFVGKVLASSQSYKDGQLVAIVKQQDQIISNSCRDLIFNKYPFDKSSKNEISLKELAQIFGKTGSYLTTLNSNVQVASGQQVPYRVLLEQGLNERLPIYKNIENVNSLYFEGADSPNFKLTLRVKTLSKNAESINIFYGGKKYEYFHGPIKSFDLDWPNKNDQKFLITLKLINNNKSPKLTADGEWSLFRMLDKAENLKLSNDSNVLVATFVIENEKVVIEFQSRKNKSPIGLDWIRGFNC
ncbi:type VI secretion system membrane subunit TssM [Acinetobacter faecalis]|uniref:type VI secretion system membrane subunit TssM n=1 Tax=Acinetobacter faecalis TaxID=2665161 RepID=UPI002A920CDC|nr:type VI secretion system membrane subunit TssM [Acinetobacter faecalis]MDY6450943.1 type VI secretion system membrane subunit TssM [Acinetobacter faecalis]